MRHVHSWRTLAAATHSIWCARYVLWRPTCTCGMCIYSVNVAPASILYCWWAIAGAHRDLFAHRYKHIARLLQLAASLIQQLLALSQLRVEEVVLGLGLLHLFAEVHTKTSHNADDCYTCSNRVLLQHMLQHMLQRNLELLRTQWIERGSQKSTGAPLSHWPWRQGGL